LGLDLALPLPNLHRVYAVGLPDLADGLDPSDRLQAHLRLERRRVGLALRLAHVPLPLLGWAQA